MAFGLDSISNFLKRFEQEVENLGNLNQALGLLQGTAGAIFGLVSPMYGAIQAADEYNKSILNSQIAFSVATTEIDAFGNIVENFADRLSSSAKQFQQLEVDLEIETRTIVGLTSQRLSGILSEVVQESNSIFGQYSEKAGSSITDVFKNLTSNLAATYSLLGSPVYQDPQETMSLLQGNVTDPNSFVASKLNISRQEADEAQSQGKYIDLLIQKTQAYRTASTLSANSLENITSNLQDIQEISQREFGQPILKKFTDVGSQFFNSITSTQRNATQDIKVSTAQGVLSIDKDLEKSREKLITSNSDSEKKSISDNIIKLSTQREDIINTASEKLSSLGVVSPKSELNNIIRDDLSISGREKLIESNKDSYTLEKTNLDSIVVLAQEFGELFANLLDKLAEVFTKIGNIFDNLNIGELIEGATSGFISGLSSSLEAISSVLMGVLSVLETITMGLKSVIDPILNIETGTTIGVIAGVLAALTALGSVVSGLSTGFLFLIRQASILATTFSSMSRRQQAQVLSGSAINSFDGVLSGIRTNQTDLRNNVIRKSNARREAARAGSGPISGFFRSIGDFFGAQAEGYGARTRPNAAGRSYGLNPFGTFSRVIDAGSTRASRVATTGFSGAMAKTGIMLQAFTAAIGSLLPLLLGAVAIIAVIVLGARALNKFVSNLALTEGPLRGIAEAARKLINSLDFLGKYFKKQKESLNKTDDKITKELNTPLSKLQEIGGKEGYNRKLVGTDADYEEVTKLQKEFFDTYNKGNLVLSGSDKELEEKGYSKEDIKNIKKLRKDQAEVGQIKSLQEEISETYNNIFGQEISSGFKQVEQPYKGGFSEGLLSRLSRSLDYRDTETSAGKGTEKVTEELEGISTAFETLNSQNLLGTDSLNQYAETFKLASQNEILNIEERNKFISLYNQAIDKENELTGRFLTAAEMVVKAREKTGEIGQAESDLEMARINVERARGELSVASKKGGINNSLINESQNKLESSARLREESTNKGIAELAPLFRDLEKLKKEQSNIAKSSSNIPELEKQLDNITIVKTRVEQLGGLINYTKEGLNKNIAKDASNIISKSDIAGSTKSNIQKFFNQLDNIANDRFDIAIDKTPNKIIKGQKSKGIYGSTDIDREVRDYDAIIKGFNNSSSNLGISQFVKASSEQLKKTYAYVDKVGNITSQPTKDAIDQFLDTGIVDLEKLSPEVDKEKFVMAIRDIINEVKDNKDFKINLKPIIDSKYLQSEIENLEKKISELSGQIIIEFDDNYATKKLKDLRTERENIKDKIISGNSTSNDISNAKSIDRKIDSEENRINRIILKNRKSSLQEEISGLEKKEKLSPEEQKSLDNAKAKLKVVQDTDKILAEREKLSSEYSSKSITLNKVNKELDAENKKEKPDVEVQEKLKGEANTISKRLAEIDKQLVIDRFSQLETAEASVKGNKELSKLSTTELIAKNKEVIAAEKLYEIEKLVTEEKKQQERLAISISRASLEVAKAQNVASGSFTPELFETEIGQKKIDELKTLLEQARVSVVENNKKINEAYKSIGSDGIKTTLNNINQLGPVAFKEEIENLTNKTFKDSEEALKFAEKSVNTGVNADRILNATKITQEVKDAYKFIYGKDIDPNANLNNLQNKVLNTKGGLTTENAKATSIGEIKSGLETNELTLQEAIKKAQNAGINGINGDISKEKLIDTLTVEYGKSLESDELIKNLDSREQSLIKVQQLESSIKDAVKGQIDNLIKLANEEEKRFNRLERIKTLIDTFGTEGISDLEASSQNAVIDFKEAFSNLKNTELYKNPEKMYQLLGKNSGVTLADLQKLNNRGGLSEEDSSNIKAVLESIKNLSDIAGQKILSLLEKRLEANKALELAGNIGLGPNRNLLNEEGAVISSTLQVDTEIKKLQSEFERKKLEDNIIGKKSLSEIDVTDGSNIDLISNILGAASQAMNSFTDLAVRRISDMSNELASQINILNSLQSAYNSISQAAEIYNSIANKAVNQTIESYRESENKPEKESDKILEKINSLKQKQYEIDSQKISNTQSNREQDAIQKEIDPLYNEYNNALKREGIENKINKLKEEQAKVEELQAQIALKRQEIENKISQLKNKQVRLELYAQRAKIAGIEDPQQRARELAINSKLLGLNKLEGNMLLIAGNIIKDAGATQKRLSDNGKYYRNNPELNRIEAETALRKSKDNSKSILNSLGNISSEADSLINSANSNFPDSRPEDDIAAAEKAREELKQKLLDSLPKDVFDKLSDEAKKDINPEIKNQLVSITEAIKSTGIDTMLGAIEDNTGQIANALGGGQPIAKQEQDRGNSSGGKTPTNKGGEAAQIDNIFKGIIEASLNLSGKKSGDIDPKNLPKLSFEKLDASTGGMYYRDSNEVVMNENLKPGLLSGDRQVTDILAHEIRHWMQDEKLTGGTLNPNNLPEGAEKEWIINTGIPGSGGDKTREEDAYIVVAKYGEQLNNILKSQGLFNNTSPEDGERSIMYNIPNISEVGQNYVYGKQPENTLTPEGNSIFGKTTKTDDIITPALPNLSNAFEKMVNTIREFSDKASSITQTLPTVKGIESKNIPEVLKQPKQATAEEILSGKQSISSSSIFTKPYTNEKTDYETNPEAIGIWRQIAENTAPTRNLSIDIPNPNGNNSNNNDNSSNSFFSTNGPQSAVTPIINVATPIPTQQSQTNNGEVVGAIEGMKSAIVSALSVNALQRSGANTGASVAVQVEVINNSGGGTIDVASNTYSNSQALTAGSINRKPG